MSLNAALRDYRIRAQASHIGVASVVVAADFATGGEAWFARACSAKGDVLEILRRGKTRATPPSSTAPRALQPLSQRLALPIHDDLRFGAYAAFGTSGRTGSFGFFTA